MRIVERKRRRPQELARGAVEHEDSTGLADGDGDIALLVRA